MTGKAKLTQRQKAFIDSLIKFRGVKRYAQFSDDEKILIMRMNPRTTVNAINKYIRRDNEKRITDG